MACMFADGWHTLHVANGDSDLKGIYEAIETARTVKDKPTIIRLRYEFFLDCCTCTGLMFEAISTTIGFGSKLQGTHGVHGNVLKPDDTEQIKTKFGFDPKAFFVVPDEVQKVYTAIGERGAKVEASWNEMMQKFTSKFAEEAKDLESRLADKLPEGWEKCLPVYKVTDPAIASRTLSQVSMWWVFE